MSISRLGRAKGLEKYWSEHLGDQRETAVDIISTVPNHVVPFDEVERYPFTGQIELKGEFEFEIPGRNGEPFTQTGEYQYRTESGLFLLLTPSDLVDPETVFSEINTSLSSRVEIQEALSLSRQSLWEFISVADSVEKLNLRGSNGTYDATLLIELLRKENPIEALNTAPEFSELNSIDNIKDIIESAEPHSDIDGIQDLDIDLYDTLIDEVEATYWFEGSTAKVRYLRGELQIDAENSDVREYAIQLFERDVMVPE